MNPFQMKANQALKALWFFLIAMAVLLGDSQVLSLPSTELSFSMLVAGLILWLFKTAPLWVAAIAMRRRSHKASAWLAYACLFYFILWMLVAFTADRAVLGGLGAASSIGLFLSCMLFTRWEKRALIAKVSQ